MTDDLYVTCPRCEGRGDVSAITDPGNEFRPSRSETFDCPLCHGMKTIDRDKRDRYLRDHAEDEE